MSAFELFAELSLALGGFTGVAASFGGRDREFRQIEVSRISGVFWFAGISLVDALLVISLTYARIPAAEIYAVSCFVAGFLVLVLVLFIFPPVVRLYRAGESTTGGTYILSSSCFMGSLFVLYMWAAFFSHEPWPLVCGISGQLVWGLWIFSRLLLRSN